MDSQYQAKGPEPDDHAQREDAARPPRKPAAARGKGRGLLGRAVRSTSGVTAPQRFRRVGQAERRQKEAVGFPLGPQSWPCLAISITVGAGFLGESALSYRAAWAGYAASG